jgi:uncharacterized protein (DUF39 family)
MAKTIEEINEKIRKGKAVVLTAEEIIDYVAEKGVKKAAQEVDVVTTGTFGPMCSSGAYFNVGHTKPRIKLGGGKTYLNDVPVYTGFAAVDFFLGATAMPEDDPRNKIFPGKFLEDFHGFHLYTLPPKMPCGRMRSTIINIANHTGHTQMAPI